MKLTPLDIHHKEFRHSIRGYSEDEVDQFLDEVADEFERLFKENIDLNEKLEALRAKVNEFEMQRQTINNTLMTAQRSADDIIARASSEAEGIVAHASTRAKEIVNDALSTKQQVRGELLRIKQAEEDFRAEYKTLLESSLRSVSDVKVADDVNELLGSGDESAEDVLAEQPGLPAAAAPSQPAAVPAPPAPAPAELPTEPPAPGFVQAVSLGEIEPPEIPPDVALVEPSEFALPGFDQLGEREDDSDIEEID
jgi:cell division initiation protein